MQSLQVPEKVIVSSQAFTFVVFGLGGTGSYLARDLIRTVGIFNHQYQRNDSVLLIDGDTVEEHNLLRQYFVAPDVGKNKAEVLALRYGAAAGIEVGFIPEYFRENNIRTVQQNACSNGRIPVYIGCVDNNKTRNMIHKLYRSNSVGRSVYLDSGNEEYAGQVVFSSTFGLTNNAFMLSFNPGNSDLQGICTIPDAVELFSLEPTDRHPDDLSCAERAVHAPQNIATNIMAGTVLFNYCNSFLAASVAMGTIDQRDLLARAAATKTTRGISNHVTFFNSRTGDINHHSFPENVSAYINKYKSGREQWLQAEAARNAPPVSVEAVVEEGQQVTIGEVVPSQT